MKNNLLGLLFLIATVLIVVGCGRKTAPVSAANETPAAVEATTVVSQGQTVPQVAAKTKPSLEIQTALDGEFGAGSDWTWVKHGSSTTVAPEMSNRYKGRVTDELGY